MCTIINTLNLYYTWNSCRPTTCLHFILKTNWLNTYLLSNRNNTYTTSVKLWTLILIHVITVPVVECSKINFINLSFLYYQLIFLPMIILKKKNKIRFEGWIYALQSPRVRPSLRLLHNIIWYNIRSSRLNHYFLLKSKIPRRIAMYFILYNYNTRLVHLLICAFF